eukprot:COSAG01_NODE_766_length_13741_cov_16.630479_7_plen_49_part_00
MPQVPYPHGRFHTADAPRRRTAVNRVKVLVKVNNMEGPISAPVVMRRS